MKILSLLIPGLLGPLPELNQPGFVLPECRVLNTWLARAQQKTTQGHSYYQQLAELFGVQADFSIVHASASYDQCDCSQAYWYRADPVHFKADMDHAIMFDSRQLDINRNEAESLAAHFNRHFAEDGLQLVVAHTSRWYLRSQRALNINTTALGDAIGRNVSHFLPSGEGALNWRRLLNEAQMLFHTHPVNQRRESSGQLSINSLWLWGEGDSPIVAAGRQKPPTDFQWLMSDEVVANGLARLKDCAHLAVPESFAAVSDREENGLIIIDKLISPVNYGDVLAWHDALMDVCQQCLQPLDRLLTERKIKQLNLYTGEGRLFIITANKLLKFWRRPAALIKYMNTHA
jgi:hypothetical protein